MNGQFCCLQSSTSFSCHRLTKVFTENRDDWVLQTSPGLLIAPTGIIGCEATALYSLKNAGNCKCSIYTLSSCYVWAVQGDHCCGSLLFVESNSMMRLHGPSQGKAGFRMGSPKEQEKEWQKRWVEPITAWSQSKDYLNTLDFYWQLTQ